MKSLSLNHVVKSIAALVDLSLVFQLLFVPLAFGISATRAQAQTVEEPVVEVAEQVEATESAQFTLQEDEAEVSEELPADEASAEATAEPTPAAQATPTPEPTPTAEPTATPAPTAEPTPAAEPATIVEEPGFWNQVALNTTYVSPDNDKVTVTFTSLPANPGNLRISQVTLNAEQMAEAGTKHSTAYEITSDMVDGTFTYDLTLPNPSGKSEVEVQYSENGRTFEEADSADLTVKTEGESSVVTIKGLDHFTIFVVVPEDVVPTTVASVLLQGWRLSKSGNAETALVSVAGHGASNAFGQHSVRMNRVGGAGMNRSYLGYFEHLKQLSSVEEISFNRFSVSGNDTYMNIFIRKGLQTATVVYNPPTASGVWQSNTFSSATSGNISIRIGGTTQNISYADLMTNYGDWWIENQVSECQVSGFGCLNPINYFVLGGIVFVSGSSSPTAAQDHLYDGINIKFAGQNAKFFDFALEEPVQPVAPVQVGFNQNGVGASNPAANPTLMPCVGALTRLNGVSAVWEDTNTNANIKYQRQYSVNGGATWTGNEIYTTKNTNFRNFGSGGAGTEMTVHGRIRAFYDYNANNSLDNGELVSDWSNVCDITLDRTAPAMPTGLRYYDPATSSELACGVTTTKKTLWPRWNAVGGSDFSHYEYTSFDAAANPQGWQTGLNEMIISTTEFQHGWVPPVDGKYGFAVRAVDNAGNKSAWATGGTETWEDSCQYMVETPVPNTAPVVTIESPTPAENTYVRGTITGRAVATDDYGMGSYYLRFWQNAFEIANGGTLRGNCQSAPGGDLLGTSQDVSCAFDTTAFADGPYVFSAQFLDASSVWGQALRSFTVDNTKPVVEILNPTTAGAAQTAPISVRATDNYQLDRVTINIYNSANTLVKSCAPFVHTPAVNEYVHECAVDSLPEGNYSFKTNALDMAGNLATTLTRTFVIDRTAPTAPVINGFLNPTMACGVTTNLTNITVDWTDSVDVGGLQGYEYNIDYPLIGGGRGEWNSFFGGSQYTGSLNPGIHHIKVRARDNAGNVSAWSNICSITSDSEAPSTPTNGDPDAEYINTNDFWFTWSDESDGGSPVTYEFQSSLNPAQTDGVLTTNVWKSVDHPGNPQFFPLNTPTIHSTGAPNGKWYWQVRTVDAAGNKSAWSEIWDVTIDTVAPVVSITNPLNSSVISGVVPFRGTVLDENLLRYHYSISNGVTAQTVTQDASFTDQTVYTWNTQLFPDGVYTLKLEARDKALNKTSASVATVTVTVDNTAPAAPTGLTFLTQGGEEEEPLPLACGSIVPRQIVSAAWNANEESDFSHYEYTSFNAPDGSVGLSEQVMNTNVFVSNWLAPMDGTYGYAVRAVDNAGNKSAWSVTGESLDIEGSCQITFDSVAPTALVTSHTEGKVLTDAGSVTVAGNVADDLKLAEYTFVIENSLGDVIAGPGTVSTANTAESVSFLWDTSLVANGQYTIVISAVDAAGNADETSSDEVTVTVQNTVPEVLGASTGGPSSSSSFSAPGPASPPVCSAGIPGTIGGLSIATTASGAILSWSRPSGPLTHYAMEFVRLDAAGNETGRYGVDRFGNADTTSFNINNLPGGSSYRFELFAVNDCAPGARTIASSGTITAPGIEFGQGGVTITPNQGEAAVLGASTDEEVAQAAEETGEIAGGTTNSLLSGVLGASTENCSTTSWWWIILPAFFALLALIRVSLTGKKRSAAHLVLLLAAGFGLFQTLCNPWIWMSVVAIATVLAEILARRATKASNPFPGLKKAKPRA